jgi:hypothetical protein
MNHKEIQHWNLALKKLEHPQKTKIKKFLENGCIVKVNDDTFNCVPLLGYNSTTYTMKRGPEGTFNCNCQGFNKRLDCSHVQALYLKIGKDSAQGVLF